MIPRIAKIVKNGCDRYPVGSYHGYFGMNGEKAAILTIGDHFPLKDIEFVHEIPQDYRRCKNCKNCFDSNHEFNERGFCKRCVKRLK